MVRRVEPVRIIGLILNAKATNNQSVAWIKPKTEKHAAINQNSLEPQRRSQ